MFVVTDFVFVLSSHTHSLVVAAGCVESQKVLELLCACVNQYGTACTIVYWGIAIVVSGVLI